MISNIGGIEMERRYTPCEMNVKNKDFMYIEIDLTYEQEHYIKEKNKKLGELLDRTCVFDFLLKDYDSDTETYGYHYRTDTYEDYESFIEIINMIANRRD